MASKTSGLGLTAKKAGDFGEWYTQLITKAELIAYYEVSGCYILLPGSYSIWEQIQGFFDCEIKKLGVVNVYFPVFVSKRALEAEKDHVEGFAPEVAWVTRSGTTELEQPIAIRPTSETIIYPYFAKKVQSHRDLPLKFNQWTNVVRWEFKHPTPFLRTREFLWQEGHTAFATVEEADVEVFDILDLYARVYEQLLAVPVIKGRKSEKEKFAGGRFTTTVEAFIPGSHRAIQGATSHSLGQNFAKMCGITFEGEQQEKTEAELAEEAAKKAKIAEVDSQIKAKQQQIKDLQKEKGPEAQEQKKSIAIEMGTLRKEHAELKKTLVSKNSANLVWQNSWGLTTRTIGVMVMVHSDDTGLVLPPRVAPTQVVIVGIPPKSKIEGSAELWKKIDAAAEKAAADLVAAGVRAVYDKSPNTPGWKYNFYELRGIPVRIEIGVKDLEKNSASVVRRVDGKRADVALADLAAEIPVQLEQIQAQMLDTARRERDANIAIAYDWETFCKHIGEGKLVLAPWCELIESEEEIKEITKKMFAPKKNGETQKDDGRSLTGAAKSLCLPFAQPPMPEGQLCFTGNGKPATGWCLWGRSY